MPMEFLFFDKRVRICNKHKNTRRFAPGKVSKNEVKVKAGCLCSRKNSENIQKVKKILLKIEQYCCRSPRGERGLKYVDEQGAPHMHESFPARGTWIEMFPARGTWIEICR